MNDAGILVPIALFVCGAATMIFMPLTRAFGRRMDREANQGGTSHEITSRLERMEQAIDSIAIEVERISEGQRFTTKLLSERTSPTELPSRANGGQ
ncbi:MAG TPA: hypothetical protein VGM67_04320 [Gemmatimonadaceae bacterium]|jgi:hypothetical protein